MTRNRLRKAATDLAKKGHANGQRTGAHEGTVVLEADEDYVGAYQGGI